MNISKINNLVDYLCSPKAERDLEYSIRSEIRILTNRYWGTLNGPEMYDKICSIIFKDDKLTKKRALVHKTGDDISETKNSKVILDGETIYNFIGLYHLAEDFCKDLNRILGT